jgi:hypothetical protein
MSRGVRDEGSKAVGSLVHHGPSSGRSSVPGGCGYLATVGRLVKPQKSAWPPFGQAACCVRSHSACFVVALSPLPRVLGWYRFHAT